jgi:hypothetical protein
LRAAAATAAAVAAEWKKFNREFAVIGDYLSFIIRQMYSTRVTPSSWRKGNGSTGNRLCMSDIYQRSREGTHNNF